MSSFIIMETLRSGCGIYSIKCRPNCIYVEMNGDTCNKFHMWMS